MGLINTVLGYKKGSKTKNIFSISENIMFQLSNELSIVFISLQLVKLRQIKILSAAPHKYALRPLHLGDISVNTMFQVVVYAGKVQFCI